MAYEDEALLDVSPAWSGLLLVVAARGVEELSGEDLAFDRRTVLEPQRQPLLGVEWAGEAYIDTGSRGARSLSGAEEGFVLKTSLLLRYWNGEGLEERILYPYSEGAPSFLLVRGDDRKRQASLYVAELAAVLALLQDDPPLPVKIEGPLLVVRHGSLLQSLGAYFNEVFDLDRKSALAVLKYAGLRRDIATDLVDAATVARGVREAVNPGILSALLLGMIRERAAEGGHTVVGLTEDVSVGRHLMAIVLARVISESARAGRSGPRFEPFYIVDTGLEALGGAEECLEDFSVRPDALKYDAARYLRLVAAETLKAGDKDDAVLGGMVRELGLGGIIRRIYEEQALKRFNLASDSHFLLLYNYLYREPGERSNLSVEVSKSGLYTQRILKSYRERISEPPVSDAELARMISGVALRYLFPETAPSCLEIGEEARRLGVDRRTLADMIRVVPPVRVEYFQGDPRLQSALQHLLAQSLVTSYGVPPQLLVVDSRSRVNEWEYSALAGMLEELSRRVAPYSTFIRDFTTRARHIL